MYFGKKLNSRRCNHQEMAEFMSTLGIQSAYNLDGGMSSVMIMNGRYIDDNTHEAKRAQSGIIYVVSAVNPDKSKYSRRTVIHYGKSWLAFPLCCGPRCPYPYSGRTDPQ